ncbi:MAG: hypothetical protein CL946_04175 [Ectothiorhodospiraceae bacterium]|nr:hypothetical protein [Ectothiorhodospiraceae bacterium]
MYGVFPLFPFQEYNEYLTESMHKYMTQWQLFNWSMEAQQSLHTFGTHAADICYGFCIDSISLDVARACAVTFYAREVRPPTLCTKLQTA